MSVADLWERIRLSYSYWLHTWPGRYGFSVLAVALATTLEFGLRLSGPFHQAFILFYPAVVLVAMQAGFWPGIVATVLAAVSGGYFFLEPTYSFVVRTPEDLVGPTLFALIGVALTSLTYSRNQAKQALRGSEIDLNRAQAVAHIGSWRHDIQKNTLVLSDEACRILGLEPGSEVTPEGMANTLHPDDRERVREEWAVALTHGAYDAEQRVLVGGRTRWVRVQANVESDETGRSLAVVGTVQDITERKQAHERLEEYEKAMEGLDEMILVVDRDYRYVIANRAFLNGRGMEREQLIGRPLAEMMGDGVFETTVKPKLDECFGGSVVSYEKRYKYPALGERDFWVSYFPLTDARGVDRVAVVMQDITEKKQADRALRLFRALIDQSNDAVEVVDPDTLRFLDINEQACKDLGYTREEMLRMTVFDISPEVDEAHRAKVLAIVRDSGHATFQVVHRRKDGSMFPVEVSLRYVQLDRNYVVAVARDISDRKRTEDALRESEDRYRDLVEHSEDLVCTHDLEGRLISVNPAPARVLGYDVADLLKISMRDLIAPEFREQFDAYLARIKTTGADKGLLCILTRGGERRIWEYNNTLRTEGVTSPIVRGMAHDVTERKRAEAALRRSEKSYRQLFEKNIAGVAVSILDGRVLDCNDGWARILGYDSAEEVRGQPTRKFYFNLADREPLLDELRQGEGFLSREMQLRRKDGTPVWVLFSCVALSADDGTPIVQATMIDISERKQAEEALRGSEERFRSVYENSTIGIYRTTPDGKVLLANPSLVKMLGFSSVSELSDRNLQEEGFEPGYERAEFQRRLASEGEVRGQEASWTRRDGTAMFVRESAKAIRNAKGEITYYEGTVEDVTEHKRAEVALRQSEEDYRRFVAQSSEGIFRQDLDQPIPIDLPEEELVRGILYGSYLAECNDAMARMYGFKSARDFLGKRLTETLDASDSHVLELTRGYVRSGFRLVEHESHEVDIHGNPKVFLNSLIGIVENGKLVRTWGIQRDVTETVRLEEERKQAEALVSLQKETLETIARGMPLTESLTTLLRVMESQRPGLVGSVLLLEEDGLHVRHGAAPSLPEAYIKAIDGAAIGPSAGSCGTAMYRKEPVIVTDVMQSPLWSDYRDLAVAHGVRACWSTPILSAEAKVLGSFAMYYAEPRGPSEAEMRLTEVATHLASIAIERSRAEEVMRQSEERFRVALKDSPITVFNQDRDLRYTWIHNPSLCWQREIVGRTDDEIMGASQARHLVALKQRVLETGTGLREEVVIPHNGSSYSFDVTLEPLRDASGGVVGITGAAMDIARLRELADSLQKAKDRLVQEKQYLESEIQAEFGFEKIIGQSPALREVLKSARVVAPTDSTVLLLGETGTGKELVARAIHSLSARQGKNFIKLNCAAVPTGLLESELFGHEKGAFTGAVNQKIGRLELADKGTLFLDEIGELPLELQPKLLRVLQDREFERLGGVRTVRVDVRIISATNRDLRKDVAEKRFREDLFYRLNVFPISMPPLHERRSDIPALVRHFVQKHAARMGKSIATVPGETLKVLQNWSWPGNIRELENMIERMVILTKGDELAAPPLELDAPQGVSSDDLKAMGREHIIRILQETRGVLSGTDGAASRLGVKRTTLQSMLKRFGIEPEDFRRGTGTYGPE